MHYSQPVYRPPSEARSFILQVTHGCSYNRCSFCAMYLSKRFRARPLAEIEQDIVEMARIAPDTRRVFLADGDAMVLSAARLTPILDLLATQFPRLQRVTAYTDAKAILGKSDAELAELRARNLRLVYLGLESGSAEVLALMRKEASAAEMSEAMRRAHAAGIKSSVIVLLGAGGRTHSEGHAIESARVASEISPHYLSALTLTVVPGTELAAMVERGEFQPIGPEQSLAELRTLVERLEPARPTIFRTNHASNYLPLEGVLPRNRDAIVATIDRALAEGALRPEWMRGL